MSHDFINVESQRPAGIGRICRIKIEFVFDCKKTIYCDLPRMTRMKTILSMRIQIPEFTDRVKDFSCLWFYKYSRKFV